MQTSLSASSPSLLSRQTPRRIAVIGAGAAGLVAARELWREGHDTVVYERAARVGGTWVYTPAVESDPLSLDPSRPVIHSSMYASLRTNLPRECMGFLDYPFVAQPDCIDPRRFPGHAEVLKYLEDFARDFEILPLVRFNTEVVRVKMAGEGKWAVKYSTGGVHSSAEKEAFYDGVVVCNGHFTEPRLTQVPGIDTWPGKQMHSHNYRVPEPFKDKVVVLIGNASSGADISIDISKLAKEVHIAIRSATDTPKSQPGYANLWLHSMIKCAREDGSVVFQDGCSVHADVIMHCTGYKYHLPFLDTNGFVTIEDNRVGPLYKHIFPPPLAPFLCFIGLPWKVAPFPMCELQRKWVAGVLSGRLSLPAEEDMMQEVRIFYSNMEAAGLPKRDTHNLDGRQFEYDDWLAKECGCPVVEDWRKQMYAATSHNRVSNPDRYRDEWYDDNLVAHAHEDFLKFLHK